MPYRHKEQRKPILRSIFDWFSNNDFGLGPVVNTKEPYPHAHSWEYYSSIRCGWRIEEGHAVGQRISIDLALMIVEKNPGKNETKASQLRDWRNSGYQFVHASQTVYRCKVYNCGVTKKAEVYVAPVKGDGSGPIIVDIRSMLSFQRKFTETTRIPIACGSNNNRREVPVEPMKRHGVKPKSERQAPIVAMED